MVTIVICVGSSCHVRGSDRVAEILEQLLLQEGLQDRVELQGAFCMEHCSMGVSVSLNGQVYHGIVPEDTASFFHTEVIPWVRQVSAV